MKTRRCTLSLLLVLGTMLWLIQAVEAVPKDKSKSADRLTRDFFVAPNESVSRGDVVILVSDKIMKGSGESVFGPDNIFSSDASENLSTCTLSSTKVVIAYRDPSDLNAGMAVVGEIAGSSIAFGPEHVFDVGVGANICTVALSETAFAIAYEDENNSSYGTAVVGEVTGDSITFGSEGVFNDAVTDGISATAISQTALVVSYVDVGDADSGTAVVGEVSGDSISFGSVKIRRSLLFLSPRSRLLTGTMTALRLSVKSQETRLLLGLTASLRKPDPAGLQPGSPLLVHSHPTNSLLSTHTAEQAVVAVVIGVQERLPVWFLERLLRLAHEALWAALACRLAYHRWPCLRPSS
ncbi:MAG: hypothetical protein ACYSYV_07630 [Planctomycetota bacterium]|jgi:hypothetical protein